MWGQNALIISSLSPKRDWGPKRVKSLFRIVCHISFGGGGAHDTLLIFLSFNDARMFILCRACRIQYDDMGHRVVYSFLLRNEAPRTAVDVSCVVLGIYCSFVTSIRSLYAPGYLSRIEESARTMVDCAGCRRVGGTF